MNFRLGIILMALTGSLPALSAAPVISNADRTVQFPSPGAPISFQAGITDDSAAINNAVLYVDTTYPSAMGTVAFTDFPMTLETGSTWTATLPAAAEGTYVKWFVEATNANNEVTRFPAAQDSFRTFQVSAEPVHSGHIVITEILADPEGGDGTVNSEWFEIYNRSSREIDLSYFLIGNYPTGPNARQVREGTKIPANSYLVFAGSKNLFMTANPSVDEAAIYDIGWTGAVLPNSGGLTNNAFIAHANEINWQGHTVPFGTVPYLNGQDGWPNWATTNSNTVSLQLADPSLDNLDGLNWNMSPVATPGAANRVITHAGPADRYPAANSPVIFEAVVETWATEVKLYYRVTGAASFSSIDLIPTATADVWSGSLPSGFPDNTVVEWYLEVPSVEGIVRYPFNGQTQPLTFWVRSSTPQPDTVVINEIVYDPQGGDNNNYPEWIELYNPGATPVDLHNVIIGRNLNIGDGFERVFPAGTVIQAGDYLVLAGNRNLFGSIFSTVPSNIIFDLEWGTASVLNNTAGVVNLRYPGSNLRDDVVYIDQVPYQNSAPWPAGLNNNGGASIELINPALDNSQPHNWRTSVGDTFAGANRGTPGYRNSTFTSDIDLTISSAGRSIQYPASADSITITAELLALNTVSQAQVFVATSETGPYTAHTMTGPGGSGEYSANIGSFADGTYVRYYVEATVGGTTKRFPDGGFENPLVFLVEDGTPVGSDDVAFNEIQADPQGVDNGASSEWVEIMNLRDVPVDLSYFVFSPKAAIGSDAIVIPAGTILPPRGYLLIVGNKPLFEAEYADSPFTFDDNLVIGAPDDWIDRSALTNGNNIISLRHVNAWGYTGPEGDPVDIVSYDTTVIGTGNNGLTAELTKPGLPNHDNQNWAASLVKGGTPGASNSQYRPVVMTIGRDIEFPGSSDTIVFTVKAEPQDQTLDVAGVELYISQNGSAYDPVPLTYNAGMDIWESAALGPYPLNTALSFYAVGTDSVGDSSAFPIPYADHNFDLLITRDGNHVNFGDVVINEILYDNVGADTYEFIELFNATADPIDLSFFRVADNELRPFVFPQGTIIPGNGYIVLSMDSFILRTRYPIPAGVQLFSWENRFNLANGGDIIRLVHPNQYRNDEVVIPTEQVQYGTIAPWPFWTDVNVDSPNVTGRSIELINPFMVDRGTNGNSWAWTTNVVSTEPMVQGTPGMQNSVFNPNASVSDWTLY